MSESNPAATGGPRPLDWRIGGVLLGLLSTLAVALQGPLGISTAYVKTEAMIAEKVAPGFNASNAYFAKVGAAISPGWLVVLGVILGALAASFIWRSRVREAVPAIWREHFGPRTMGRFVAAFAGGFCLLFGARLAGGCTSGHSISGMSQLALSGMVFTAAVFASGIPVALVFYRKRA
ncbi:MAG TPA: YeeE/YedE thiosulfate transporter family protein [Myxococcaceae bacterium]|nr:YeeE/YedE thiosulfate transporter family protein [Myxococcaceae bacterium]